MGRGVGGKVARAMERWVVMWFRRFCGKKGPPNQTIKYLRRSRIPFVASSRGLGLVKETATFYVPFGTKKEDNIGFWLLGVSVGSLSWLDREEGSVGSFFTVAHFHTAWEVGRRAPAVAESRPTRAPICASKGGAYLCQVVDLRFSLLTFVLVPQLLLRDGIRPPVE